MLKFFAGAFAIAGLIAASGPIIIHLLNRRRFRVVEWGAMDFLRQAMQRSRRAVQLRDLIILVIRCLAVALFGAALARPFLSGVATDTILGAALTGLAVIAAVSAAAVAILTSKPGVRGISILSCVACFGLAGLGLFEMLQDIDTSATGALTSREPVHAVLLIDNSMSMGYESLDGTLLDRARAKSVEFIDALPAGSQVHIIPICGSSEVEATSAYRNKTDAKSALDRVQIVDRIGRAGQALELANEACRQVPQVPAKRIVLISDQQTHLWLGGTAKSRLEALADVQIMRIAPETVENVWISDFKLQDGVADTETPAVFLATVRYSGEQPVTNVQVALSVEGEELASRLIDLEPGQSREIEFRQQLGDVTDTGALGEGVAAARYLKASATVSLEGGVGDRLARDNARHLVVPVVAGLPVLFIDQFGEDENLDQAEIGETYRLRRLLAPRTSTDEEVGRQLVRIRHLTPERLTEEALSDARLVVVAGVSTPGEMTPLLRQYAEQGGPLIIAAGADFDADRWNEAAWLDGSGILPGPLSSEPIGQLPEVAVGTLEPFYLDFRTMQHDFFLIEGEPLEVQEDLYQLPLFFKAVQVELDDPIVEAMTTTEAERIAAVRTFLSESDARIAAWQDQERVGNLTEDDEAERIFDLEKRREMNPEWLAWADTDTLAAINELTPEALATQSRPRVLARFSGSGSPFLVERRVGAGRILFVSTGLFSSWNTLTGTNAILMFDRMLRQLLEDTLPRRTFETGDDVTLPARRSDQLRWELTLPDKRQETLAVEALSAERFGIRIQRTMLQGHYRVASISTEEDAEDESFRSEIPLSFNCPPEESELEAFDSLAFQERMGEDAFRWLEADEPLSVEGARVRGRDLWKWLIGAVLAFLLCEMLLLASPHMKTAGEPQPST
jgi:hypothetical protein